MEIDLTTPALLFSAISLIMLAYTNRFLSYAQLVRTLKDQYRENHSAVTAATDSQLAQTPLSDACHAGDGHCKSAALRGQHVSDIHSVLSAFRLYLRSGPRVTYYLSGHFRPRDLYIGQGARTSPERYGLLILVLGE